MEPVYRSFLSSSLVMPTLTKTTPHITVTLDQNEMLILTNLTPKYTIERLKYFLRIEGSDDKYGIECSFNIENIQPPKKALPPLLYLKVKMPAGTPLNVANLPQKKPLHSIMDNNQQLTVLGYNASDSSIEVPIYDAKPRSKFIHPPHDETITINPHKKSHGI